MTGVTWVPLPADAPEPPPLSVVRLSSGDLLIRAGIREDGPWRCIQDAMDFTWEEFRDSARFLLSRTEDDEHAPWAPGDDVREERERSAHAAYLATLDAQRRAAEAQAEAFPQMLASWRDLLAGLHQAARGDAPEDGA